MRRRPRTSLFVCVFLLLVAAGTAPAGLPRDWTELDGLLDRAHLLDYYLHIVNQPADGYAAYTDAVAYHAPADSLGLAEWRSLTPEAQQRRRELAAEWREQVNRTRRTVARLYNSALDSEASPVEGASLLIEGGAALVIETIAALVNAVGLVPVDAEAWADLGYFAGCLGDTRRQTQALDMFRALHDDLPAAEQRQLAERRVRACLDLAWTMRERGEADQAVAHCLEARRWIDRGGLFGGLAGREARLVSALARAEQGRYDEARQLAAPLDDLPYHERNPIAHFFGYAQSTKQIWSQHRGEHGHDPDRDMPMAREPGDRSDEIEGLTAARTPNDWSPNPVVQKSAWQDGSSDWARDWIQAIIHLRTLDPEVVLHRIGEPDPLREYPATLSHRYWNDFGHIYEQLGRHTDARRCYAYAALYRPFFLYFPLEGRRGFSRLYTIATENRIYFVGAGHFYVSGDLYAHAAACLLAWEFSEDGERRDLLLRLAEEELTACRLRGIRPTAALAQRGRLRYLTGDLARAETDLRTAIEEFREQGVDDPDLHLILGLVHFNGADYTGAVPWLEHFCVRRPEAGMGWRALGLAAAHAGLLAAADSALSRAVEHEPDHPAGWFNRGLVRAKCGHREAALADLAEATVLLPGNAEIARVTAALESGPLPDIALSPTPIVLGAGPDAAAQIERLQQVNLAAEVGAPALADLLQTAAEDTLSAKDLEDAYLRAPTAERRLRLARRLLRDGRPQAVQELVAAGWDTGLSDAELLVLLTADRELGDSQRATALVHGLSGTVAQPAAPAVWHLVGAICLDAGLDDPAAKALQHAAELANAASGP